MTSVQTSGEHGDDRYVFERTLGQGAAGEVYLVQDRETGEQLALKKLFRMDAKGVLRLKREFRSLADVHHPNLVKLYDLGQSRDSWFLTMEYVPGRDLLAFVDGTDHTGEAGSRARLIASFHQLALGVRALHRAGMLHRDLKPSNVLVSDSGRVVVLDFGLVRELDASANKLTEAGAIAGTPAYMAPEQALDRPLTEASDWYAFGVMLYEALSGELPFDGGMMQVLRMKLALDPKPISTLVSDAPRALTDLCTALLQRDPDARPSGEEVVRVLSGLRGAEQAAATESTILTDIQAQPQAKAPLFGRDAELEELWEAADRALDGESVVAHVLGASGAGKTALVEHFLDQLEDGVRGFGTSDVLVLRSRCYEREAMPFKALDGLMDALVRHLAAWDDVDVGHLLPREIPLLARLFPGLERLRAVQRLLTAARAPSDGMGERQRAEVALRELFDRLATRRPLVLWIDDLQWGDLDSARILASWLDTPHDAPLILLLSYRSDEVTTSACLRCVLTPAAHGGRRSIAEHRVELASLGHEDMAALCGARLGAHAASNAALVARIVEEAQGSPFLVSQLAALAEAKISRGETDLSTVSLDELVEQTSVLLPEQAKIILATLAVAGRPMPASTLFRAAGVTREGRTHLHALRGLNLVRTRDVAGERLVECYHDRVRERVNSSLTRLQRVRLHENLLRAVELSRQSDADWLYSLALGAEQWGQALHYGLLAAERASATLAFERAAELYQRCLELSEDSAANGGALRRQLARALACCGRGSDAADVYLEAVEHVPPEEVVGVMRLAASHLLRSGRYEEGELQVKKVLDAMQIRVPETDKSLMAAIAWERSRLWLRGTGYTPRLERELPASMLAEVDLYDALRIETQAFDPLRSALFQLRGMRLALDAGEQTRVIRALCSAATMTAMVGSRHAEKRSAELLHQAETLVLQLGVQREYSGVASARAICGWVFGNLPEAAESGAEAERLYRSQSDSLGVGDYYRRFAALSARLGALYLLGESSRFLTEFKAALHEAQAAHNRAAELTLLLNHSLAEEIDGHPERSRARLERQRLELPKMRFGLLHALHLIAVLRAGCAAGEYAWAREYLDEVWPLYLRSPARRGTIIRTGVHTVRARFALNYHALHGGALPVESVREDLQALAKLPPAIGVSAIRRVEARLALRRDRARAIVLLREAASSFEQGGVPHDAARDRYALGVLLGGSEGAALCANAVQRLAADGYADPMRDLRWYYPELIPAGGHGEPG